MTANATKPAPTEYAEYYGKYVSLLPETDIVGTLQTQGAATVALLRGLTEAQGEYAYAEGKWSIKQLLGHINDGERVFAYRALCFARGDVTPLPGFEQDDYVATGAHNALSLSALTDEFEAIRRSTILLFRNLPDEAWTRQGIASDNPVSVRALAYIMAGHERHHVAILREKYGLN
jgi:hypothetical protein